MTYPGEWTPGWVTALLIITFVVLVISIIGMIGCMISPDMYNDIGSTVFLIFLASGVTFPIEMMVFANIGSAKAGEYFSANARTTQGVVTSIYDASHDGKISRYAEIDSDQGEIILNLDNLRDDDADDGKALRVGDHIEGLIVKIPEGRRDNSQEETAWGSLRIVNEGTDTKNERDAVL